MVFIESKKQLALLITKYIHMLNTQHHLFTSSHAQFNWVKQQVADLLISNSMWELNSTSKQFAPGIFWGNIRTALVAI